jgi:predicted aspartyl protease
MENDAMGRVCTEAKIENLEDLWEVRKGELSSEQVRQAIVPDALVDTGATMLSLPTHMIRELGLTKTGSKRIRSATGVAFADVYSPVRLTIQSRDCAMEVMEVPDGVPVLIGQLPLESLDFVLDSQGQRLIGNPAHGGEYIIDQF